MVPQNLPDFFMADLVAEFFQFSGNAVIAPPIFAGELEHQLDDPGFDGRSPDLLRLVVAGPFAFDKLEMPTEQGYRV